MTIGLPRNALASLALYKPGKSAAAAEAQHGISNAIKLASNENPYPTAPSVVAAIAKAATGLNRYPDNLTTKLRDAISDWISVDASNIAVGPGSVALLQQLTMAYLDPGDQVAYPWISFEAYPITVNMMAGESVLVDLVDLAFDLNAVAAAIGDRTKLVFLATPNNPTGTAVSTTEIAAFLADVPEHVVVVVDEAYREFADPAFGDSVHDLVQHHSNVVVCRTFSKAYGLAGLRAGYAVAQPDLIDVINKVMIPFANNSLAQVAAIAAIKAVDEIQPSIDTIIAERARVTQILREHGYDVMDSQANFVWLPLGDETVEVHTNLEQLGIICRPFAGHGIRVTIGTPEENDRFCTSLTSVHSVS